MKKTMKIILFVILVLLLILSHKVEASNSASIELKMEEPINDNKEIIVEMSIKGIEKGILGIQGTLVYDKEKIEILETTITNENFKLTAWGEDTGTFMIEIADEAFYNKDAYIYSEENILKLKIKVKDNANLNKTSIEIKDCKLVDSDFQTIEVTTNNSSITLGNVNKIKNILIIVILVIIVMVVIFYFIKKQKK